MNPLYKILSISVISIICASKMFAQSDSILCELPDTTFNNTIKDTIVLEYSKGYVRFETIRREGDKYFAVTSDNKDVEITSMINGKTRALVQDGDGHELVIDKDGNVMGVEEYKKCGGSSKLLSEHNAYRDSTMATSNNITFSKVKDETYGFDEWRGAEYDKDVYDNFNGYRPTYIGAQKQSNIKVAASQTKGIRFITERGVPIIANAADNTLNLAIGTAGKQTVYAYRDSTLVGKLCIQAYDVKEVKVHVVRVNNAKIPSADKLQNELNEIFSQAVVKLMLDELEPITIKLDHKFKHGGTRRLRAYNADQRLVINELQKRSDYNADDFYLFFVDDIERLDDEGNPTSDIIGGYMPVGWHFGFIYNNPKIAYVAHELGHGTLAMHHTFADETETFNAPKESSDNLMDYRGGDVLNHVQWKWAHENHGREWFEEEEEGEMIINIGIMRQYLKQIHDANAEYKESLMLTISQGMNFSYSKTIELEDSVKLSYLSMSTYKNSSSYSSIKPYEKATKVECDSLTTYTFNVLKPKFGELPPISFTIKTDEKQVFEDYLYGKDIDISDKVQWVSQLDESVFGLCTGCWKSSCCRRACEYMIGNTNIANCTDSVIAQKAPYLTVKGKITLASFSDNTKTYTKDEYNTEPLVYDKNNIDDGFNYIKSELQAHRPVLIGVHHKRGNGSPPKNVNRATCHWMIAVGIGIENGVRYIRFFDPGRKNHNDGTSSNNKLLYDETLCCFKKLYYDNNLWTITEI